MCKAAFLKALCVTAHRHSQSTVYKIVVASLLCLTLKRQKQNSREFTVMPEKKDIFVCVFDRCSNTGGEETV